MALPTLDLQKLYDLKERQDSKVSTVIAISGFTSKGTDKQEEWASLCQYFEKQFAFTNIYALNWEAKNVTEIVATNGDQVYGSIFNPFKNLKKGGAVNAVLAAATNLVNTG